MPPHHGLNCASTPTLHRTWSVSLVLALALFGCTSGPLDDTASPPVDSGDPAPTPCTDFADLVATCADVVLPVNGQAGDFYDDIDPTSSTLVEDLAGRIGGHETVSYDGLWDVFHLTDAQSNGAVWDIYSTIPGGKSPYSYVFGADQCGEYGGEGDCYNREHVWPSSWFGGGSPMKNDLHHVFPTDGYVNNKRGNEPFGQVGQPYWTSANGSMLGRTDQCDVNTTVFEPITSHKGDVARAIFYMATRYQGEDSDWSSSVATTGARIEPWAESVLRAWHIIDPVDAKEIARNNAVFELQGNRNPYIDHPEWLCLIGDL